MSDDLVSAVRQEINNSRGMRRPTARPEQKKCLRHHISNDGGVLAFGVMYVVVLDIVGYYTWCIAMLWGRISGVVSCLNSVWAAVVVDGGGGCGGGGSGGGTLIIP